MNVLRARMHRFEAGWPEIRIPQAAEPRGCFKTVRPQRDEGHGWATSAREPKRRELTSSAAPLCPFAVLQLCSFTALQFYSFAVLQLCSFTALQPYSFTALQLYSVTYHRLTALGTIRSCPPMYGRSTGGMVTEPSAPCQVSSSATSVRPMAMAVPFRVWTNCGLPPSAGR